MDVRVLEGSDRACDEFVRAQAAGNMFHRPAWSEMLRRDLGYDVFYLVACEGDEIRGVLPLTHVKSWLFGNRMISQAFGNYGGPLTVSREAMNALFARAVELATERNCESIEFRNIEPMPFDLQLHEGKICMHLALTADPEDLWKRFDPKVRNQVRKAWKSNITAASGGAELLDDFYGVYTIRMRQLGTPPYSRALMAAILTRFPDESRIFVVRLGDQTVGAGLTTCFNGLVEIPWAATLVEYNSLCPNHLLYWSVLEHYGKAGASAFDFGRCTAEGATYRFKKQWGPEPVNLHYQYWVRPGHELTILAPDEAKYRRKVEMWKKLPLWVTRLVGPRLSRSLP